MSARLAIVVALVLAACNDFESLSAGHDAGYDVAGPTLPAHCASGVTDEDESDVDCGGACAPCDVAHACTIPKDCQTRTCVDGQCGLTSEPPRWLKLGGLEAQDSCLFTAGPDGRLYLLFSNGVSSGALLSAYDPDLALWRQLAPLDGITYFPHAAAFGPAGRLYVVGAESTDGATDVRAYDPATNTWSVEAPLPTPRWYFATAGDAEHLYVIGGAAPLGFTSMSKMDFEIYTAAPLGQFATKPLPMPWQGWRSAATILDGFVYVLGEGNDSTGFYDPKRDVWQAITPMTTRRSYFSATVGADHRIYAIGGTTGEAYDQHRWTATAPPPAGASRSGRGRDGRIYALGPRLSSTLSRFLYAYGPQLDLMTATAPAGKTVPISGSNFATRAIVSFSWDDDPTVVASAESDDTGVVLSVSVPVGVPAGSHRLRAMDDRSRYPVSVPVTVE